MNRNFFKKKSSKLKKLYDLEIPIEIIVGKKQMSYTDILQLCEGSIIKLDKLINEPVDILVNDRKIAMGEIVVLDNELAILITDEGNKSNE